ncbi:MAG: acetyltransferase [Sphingobacteriia bacterium]|nr:acetyltransferase [Sphingobacteriia bacterium]
MHKIKKLIIYGAGETAEICADYFNRDSEYEVVAFCADSEFVQQNSINSIPVIAFEEIELKYPPSECDAFAAASSVKLNSVRKKMYDALKLKGYKCATYISSHSFVWHNVEIGENVFIFENNVIQYKVKIGNNVILWSGNHIGHQSIIRDNCFISSHVVVSGFCEIGENVFLGVNSSVNDNIKIAKDCATGNGAIIIKNTVDGMLYVGNPAKAIYSSHEAFGIK